jgi:hypothetical protein
MEEIQKVQMDRMLKVLQGMGAKYHIVVDDTVFGEPVCAERTRGPITNKGVVDYVRPFVQGLCIGEMAIIPAGDYELKRVQSCVHSAVDDEVELTTTCVDGSVQVMRLG